MFHGILKTEDRSTIATPVEQRADFVVVAEERNEKLGASVLTDKSEIAVTTAFEELVS